MRTVFVCLQPSESLGVTFHHPLHSRSNLFVGGIDMPAESVDGGCDIRGWLFAYFEVKKRQICEKCYL